MMYKIIIMIMLKTFAIDNNIPLLHEILTQDSKNVIHTFDNGEITNKKLIDTQTDCLIVRSTIKVDSDLIANTQLKCVATATTGTDHIDFSALEHENIDFISAAGANSNSVAEYVIFSILFAYKNTLSALKNSTVGIVGYGNIGSKVASYLSKMGINHIICDPIKENSGVTNTTPPLQSNATPPVEGNCGMTQEITYHDLDFTLANADIVTLHVPLTTTGEYKTASIINARNIMQLKNNSVLINTSRGGVCNEAALLNHSQRLKFVIDVWENEPWIYNKDLVDSAIIATPHIAGHSYNGKVNATQYICEMLNKKYGTAFDISAIEDKISSMNGGFGAMKQKKNINMNDFTTLLRTLSTSRELFALSEKFKSSIADNFTTFFISTRKNYPKYFETLYV